MTRLFRAALLAALVGLGSATSGCPPDAKFDMETGERCPARRQSNLQNVIRTDGTTINIEAGSDFAPGKLTVLDRMTKTKVELPGDMFALEERVRVERREENNAVRAAVVLNTEEVTKVVDEVVSGANKIDATNTGILDKIKLLLAEQEKTTAAIEALTESQKTIAESSGLSWTTVGPQPIMAGYRATVMGRGFMTGAVDAYNVEIADDSGKRYSQPIVEITPNGIIFLGKNAVPATGKSYKTSSVSVTEAGKAVKGPSDKFPLNWRAAPPSITVPEQFSGSSVLLEVKQIKAFEIDISVVDADSKGAAVKVTTATSNKAVLDPKDIEIKGQGDVRTLKIAAGKMRANGEKLIITVTATDELGNSGAADVVFIPEGGVVIDGWTLVMKIRGSDDDDTAMTDHECEKYNYDWKGWTDANTDGDQDSGLEPGNVKFQEFMVTPFKKIRMCTDDGSSKNSKTGGGNCITYDFSNKINSAQQLFSDCGKSNRAGTVNGNACRFDYGKGLWLQRSLDTVFNPSGRRGCNPQLPGFSMVGQNDARARWGYFNNLPSQGCQTGDSEDSDGAIGIGLHAQDNQCNCGAGYTRWFAASGSYIGCYHCENAWIWVQ